MMECKACNRELPEGAIFCPWCGKKQIAEKRKKKKRANGTGTVWKRKGNYNKPWCAEMNGIYIGSFISEKEAHLALARLADQDVSKKHNWTFSQVFEAWAPEHFRKVDESARGNYQTAYKHCTELYSRKFRTLRKSDFSAVIMAMEAQEYSLSSCEKVLQLFGQMSAWALEEGLISRNYSENVETVAKQKSTRKPFTKRELEAISASRDPAAMILRIIIATGCRPKDLFTAKLSDCHKDYFISGSKSEAGYDRAISVSDYGLTDYQTLVMLATIKGTDKLIGGYEGNRVYANWSKRDFADLKEALEIAPEKTTYNARHTYATAAFASGMPQELLRRQMGHSDIHTTDKIYNHADDEQIIAAGRSVKI